MGTAAEECEDALHTAVGKFEQDLLQVFRSHTEHCQLELQALRSENARLLATLHHSCQPSASTEQDPARTVDVDMLDERPADLCLPSGNSTDRMDAVVPTTCASALSTGASSLALPNLMSAMSEATCSSPGERRKGSRTSANGSAGMSDWEPRYELLPLWQQREQGTPTRGGSPWGARFPTRTSKKAMLFGWTSLLGSVQAGRDTSLSALSATMGAAEPAPRPTPITDPWSPPRLLWEAGGAALLSCDIIVLPLQVATLVSDQGLAPLKSFVASYWTLDIPRSFTQAYYVNGLAEARLRKIASRYLRTWFFVDAVLVAVDWTLLAVEVLERDSSADPEQLGYLRIGRGLRLLRLLRLVRLLKLRTFSSKLLDTVHSESLLTTLQAINHIALVVVLSHCVACGWYGLGNYFDGHRGGTWLDYFDEDHCLGYRYATSLHWSLAQFTPASMEVVATNTAERVYSICVIVLALVVFSSVVSAITEAMTHMRKFNGHRNLRHSEVRRYLGENRVSTPLTVRVWRYLLQNTHSRRTKRWCDVELFQQLPEVLQMDLRYEVFMPTLGSIPFFHHCSLQSAAAMQKVCLRAVDEAGLHGCEELFNHGQPADKMYIVTRGDMEYYKHVNGSARPATVTCGEWVSEAALWMRWFHTGTMVAKTPTMLVVLHVGGLHRIFEQYENLMPQCCEYGRLFVARANREGEISDIWGDFDSSQDMAYDAFPVGEVAADSRRVSAYSDFSASNAEGLMRALGAVHRRARGLVNHE